MFLVDQDNIYDEFKDSSNLKFKICKNFDGINALADYILKLDLKERTYLSLIIIKSLILKKVNECY